MKIYDEGLSLPTTPAISVIIPAYNVAHDLERALVSLMDQTFEDFEILLIDDGSIDETGAIADAYGLIEPRLTVIHQANQGAAAARNHGIAKASGQYLFFMDGDDWCEPTMLDALYTFALDHTLDLVITGFYIDTQTGDKRYYSERRYAPDRVYETQRAFRLDAINLLNAQLLYAPWNKLYRRAYLNDHQLQFPKTFWDDLPFNVAVMQDVSRVGCLDGAFYHFQRARAESENTRYRPAMYEKREEEDQLLRELFASWGLGDDDLVRQSLALRYAERLLGCVENLTNSHCTLTRQEKHCVVTAMLDTQRAREALKLAKPHNLMMRVLLAPMRARSVGFTLAESTLITYVKEHSSALFARLKSIRQHW